MAHPDQIEALSGVSSNEVVNRGSGSDGLIPNRSIVDSDVDVGRSRGGGRSGIRVIVRDSDTDQLAQGIGRAKYFILSSNSYKSNISSPLQNSMHATSNLFFLYNPNLRRFY